MQVYLLPTATKMEDQGSDIKKDGEKASDARRTG